MTAPTSASTARVRRHELDQLRVLATIGVVLLHTGAAVVVAWRSPTPDWWSNFTVGNLADAGGRFAVNCFFMTSGALLIDPVRRFVLRPQILRVVLPTVTWILVYAVANAVLHRQGLPGVGGVLSDPGALSVSDAVRGLLGGPAVYHLWFVYALVGLYLVTPLLRAVTGQPEPARRRLVVWFLVLWVVAALVPQWLDFFLGDRAPTLYPIVFEPLPAGYVGLFVLGFAIVHYRERIGVPSILWAVMALAGLTWAVLLTWHQVRSGSAEPWIGYHNFNPPVILYSVGVFGWFATRSARPGRITGPLVLRGSELSFRAYLVHALVLHLLRYTTPLGDLLIDRSALGVPLMVASTVLIAFAISAVLDRITPVRRWI